MKKVRLALLLLAALLLFAACKELPTLKPNRPGYLHSDGSLYFDAPLSYLAAKRSKEAVATLVGRTGEQPLYDAGAGLLCTESGDLFAVDGTFFPALAAFAPNRVSICKEDVIRTELTASSDEELLAEIASAFETDALDPAEWEAPQGVATSRYLILLFSERYPDLCFRLEYYVFEKGDDPYELWAYGTERLCVLYDRAQECYAAAPNALYQLLSGVLS